MFTAHRLAHLLLLISSSFSLQFPLSYQYRYTATVSTGAPGVGSQFASAFIDTTVLIDTINYSTAIVKFKDTIVGEHHDETHCAQIGNVRMHQSRMASDLKRAFEKPFQIYFQRDRKPIMDVKEGELLWITNLRKAVVALLRVIPTASPHITRPSFSIVTNRVNTDDTPTPLENRAFEKMEETMYGSCLVRYTLTPASISEQHHAPTLKSDIQRTDFKDENGRWSKVSDRMYVLHRAPDFSECIHLPVFMYGQNTEAIRNWTHGDHEELITQSSFGQFLFRGESSLRGRESLRLEYAHVDGGAEMKPLGVTGATLQMITNQTLTLESATHRTRKPRPQRALHSVHSMMFQIESPFEKVQNKAPEWMIFSDKKNSLHPVYPEWYLTGHFQNASIIELLKTKVLHECSEAASILETSMASHSSASSKSHRVIPSGATVATEVGEHLTSITDIVRALPKEALLDLLHKMKDVKSSSDLLKQIFTEALSAAGSPAAVAILLDEIVRHQVDPIRSYSIISTLVNVINSPTTAKQLIGFVERLAAMTPVVPSRVTNQASQHNPATQQRQEGLLLLSILVTSRAIKKVCKVSNKMYYGTEYIQACGKELDFLKIIQEEIQRCSSPSRVATLIYAMGQLSSDEAFQHISDLATSGNSSTLQRTAAIFSMMPEHTPRTLKNKVFIALQPIVESQVDSPEVRQVAIMTLISWLPNQAWWLRLVRTSWREESKAVAEFIHTATEAIAQLKSTSWHQQSEFANRALPLCRPVMAPTQHSFIKIIESFAQPPLIESETRLGWILNAKTMLPEELFLALSSRMNGRSVPLIEALFLGDDFASIWRSLRTGSEPLHASPPHGSPHLQMEFDSIMNKLGVRGGSVPSPEGLLLLRLFSDINFPVPFKLTTLQQILNTARHSISHKEMNVHFVKYINPFRREIFFPNEVGLPFIARIQTPSVLYQKGKYKLVSQPQPVAGAQAKKVNKNFSTNVSYEGNTTFSASMESTLSVLVPWQNLTLGVGVQYKVGLHAPNVTLGINITKNNSFTDLETYIQTLFDKRVPVVMVRKVPFTVSRTMTPGPDFPANRGIQKFREIQSPTKTSHKSSYHLPSAAATGIIGNVVYEGDEEFYHSLPVSIWSYFYPTTASRTRPFRRSQTTTSFDTSSNCTNRISIKVSHVSSSKAHRTAHKQLIELAIGDTKQARLQKLEQFSDSGADLISFEVQFSSESSKTPRRYELAFIAAAATKNGSTHLLQRYQMTFLKTGIPGNSSIPEAVCLQSSALTPVLPPMDRLDKLLKSPLAATLTSTLFTGHKCVRTTEVAKIKMELSITPQELQFLGRNLPAQCNFDRLDPTNSLRRAAFYDAVNMELSWKQELPGPILNSSYHAVNVIRSLAFPYIASNCIGVSSPERHIRMNLNRSLESKRATGWVSRPSCLDYVEGIPVPHVFDLVLPLHGSRTLTRSNGLVRGRRGFVLGIVSPSNQCYVQPHRVTTFDGVSYNLEPSICSRVLTTYTDHRDSFVILTNQSVNSATSGPQEYRIIMPKLHLDIRIVNLRATVNGQEVQDKISDISGNLIAMITKSEQSTEIDFPSKMHLTFQQDKLVIELDSSYRRTVAGLCGDFDGESSEDLRDPGGCVYQPNSGVIHSISWTTPPCSVPDHVMYNLRKHQWTCPRTFAALALPVPDNYNPDSCMDQAHHRIVQYVDCVCLTTMPVQRCRHNCEPLPGTEQEKVFQVKCWPMDEIPISVQKHMDVGYLPYLEATHGKLQASQMVCPTECVPKRS